MKKIGVLGGLQGNIFGITIPYYEYASKFGEVVIINPLAEEIDENIDVLILVGGADLNPASYGQKPSLYTNKANPVREWFEANMLSKYIEANIPLFGICLGLQSIVTHFGGKLIQHNSDIHPFSYTSRGKEAHEIKLTEDGWKLSNIMTSLKKYKKMKIKVNSLHHQAADPNCLGDDIISIFDTKSYDRTPEIIIHKSLPISALQFHPEEMNGTIAQKIANELMDYLLNY